MGQFHYMNDGQLHAMSKITFRGFMNRFVFIAVGLLVFSLNGERLADKILKTHNVIIDCIPEQIELLEFMRLYLDEYASCMEQANGMNIFQKHSGQRNCVNNLAEAQSRYGKRHEAWEQRCGERFKNAG